MKLKETATYPAGVDKVYALITDADFRDAAASTGGATNVKVSVEPDGDGAVVTVVRTLPAELPDFVKKLTGDTVTVKQVEKWGGPDADGNRKAAVKMSVAGQPAGLEGTAVLIGKGESSEFVVSGDVKVNVPFLGKKIEPVVAKAIETSLRHEVKEGKKRL